MLNLLEIYIINGKFLDIRDAFVSSMFDNSIRKLYYEKFTSRNYHEGK